MTFASPPPAPTPLPDSDPGPTTPDAATPRVLRLSVEQFRPRKGRTEANLRAMAERVAAAAGDVDLMVFPETAVSGYFVEGGVEEVARTLDEMRSGLGAPVEGSPDLIFGAYERGDDGVLYNSAFHLAPEGTSHWGTVHRHRKMFLPTYGLFDEARFVKPGLEVEAYDSRFGRMGMLICEEMLHSLPPTILALGGAELLVALSASPAREFGGGDALPASLERWDLAAKAITLEHGIHLALAHLVGSEGGRIFAGGSAVYGPGGRVLARGPLFREGEVRHPVHGGHGRLARVRSPMLEDLRVFLPHLGRALERSASRKPARARGGSGGEAEAPPPAAGIPDTAPDEVSPENAAPLELSMPLLTQALVTFLRDEVEERKGFQNVVVGVSGGVDSAVTLALAVKAFGPERVHAFLLPYATSSADSLIHGREVCRHYGVKPREISISAPVDAYVAAEEPELSPLRRGNLAARFRAMVLWDQSAALEAVVLGTGNKSERLLGYFTWHADDSPPVNPLGDLLKTQVWALARHLGVPSEVVTKAPSADLVAGVHDEDELGVSYAEADLILHWLLAGITPPQLVANGFREAAVARVHGLLQGTHWKRRPPTTALVSSSGIGDFYLRPVDF